MRCYLSFDCATKTLAHAVVVAEPPEAVAAAVRPRLAAAAAGLAAAAGALAAGRWAAAEAGLDAALAALAAARAAAARGAWLAAASCTDLAPGRADASLRDEERLGLLAAHLRRVLPAARALGAGEVLIEYQMGPNARARAVAAAIHGICAYEGLPVRVVPPALKNRVDFGAALPDVQARFTTSSGAAKAHAKENLRRAAAAFGFACDPRNEHIADAFMQVFGHLYARPPNGGLRASARPSLTNRVVSARSADPAQTG
jgi:hypothetical protein